MDSIRGVIHRFRPDDAHGYRYSEAGVAVSEYPGNPAFARPGKRMPKIPSSPGGIWQTVNK
jgi:hypothetical protein